MQRPPGPNDELRYACVKRSMGAIKFVLSERRKIYKEINAKEEEQAASVAENDRTVEGTTDTKVGP